MLTFLQMKILTLLQRKIYMQLNEDGTVMFEEWLEYWEMEAEEEEAYEEMDYTEEESGW